MSLQSEPAPSLADRLWDFHSAHQPFYSYKEVVDAVFSGDIATFTDAYCSGALPIVVRHACEDTLPLERLQVLLLMRVSRQLQALLTALG